MKILTAKNQRKALKCIDAVLRAIRSGNDIQIMKALDDMAELTYLIGGIKELEKRSGL